MDDDLSTYTTSQQQDAMDRAIQALEEAAQQAQRNLQNAVAGRADLVGLDYGLLVGLFESNGPEPVDPKRDARSFCEGFMLGIRFTLELQS